MNKKNPILKQALKYSMLDGYSVIPVGKDKRPLIKSWAEFQSRIASQEEIEKWWDTFPEANVAIITGKVSGITVIDVDTHKGGSPDPFPKTHTIKTGNGGLQLYYEYVEGFTVSANAYPQFPGVDLRSDGGYVVAPPSKITPSVKGADGEYKVTKSVAQFPAFPAALFPAPKKKAGKFKLNVSSGSRNNDMASTIGTILLPLKESEFESEGWKAAQAINATYSPPLPLHELQTTFESIAKKELARREKETEENRPLQLVIDDLDLMYTTKFTSKGPVRVYTMNLENMCRILRKHPSFAGRVRYDGWKNIFEIKRASKGDVWLPVEDADVLDIQAQISMLFDFYQKVGKDMVYDAVIKVGKEQVMDSAIEYLKAIEWDKKDRISTWLTHTYGVEENVYHKAIAENWLKGMVKRIVEPGSKFDFVMVLEGEQGSKKSTSLGVLGGDWYIETTMSTESKDFFMQFQGKAIIEFSEGETLSRTEVKRMKAIITTQIDKYRLPYDKISRDFPRRCIFAMTTNQEEYLKDETGNRRWFPVKVLKEEADIEWLAENRDQLLAEAYHRVVNLKEKIYEFPKDETRIEQDKRRVSDPNAELISDWYYNELDQAKRNYGITIHQVYKDCLHRGMTTKPMAKWEEMQIAGVIKDVLKLLKKDTVRNGARAMRWVPKDVTLTEEEEAERIFQETDPETIFKKW